jgi:hypothetical protein
MALAWKAGWVQALAGSNPASSAPSQHKKAPPGPQVVPELTNEPSWPTLRAHLLGLWLGPGSTHSSTCTQPSPAANSTPRQTWPPSWIGASQNTAPTDPGPLPWLRGILEALHDHPVWGRYLAKRSQLVTGLADQVRGQARRDETRPVWAPPGSRPNLAIIGEIAVWRAANGIHPNDPRPPGPAQLPTAAALWQHHLDRSLARGSDDNLGHRDIPEPPPAATSGGRRHQDRQRLPQPRVVHPNSPPRGGL